MTTWLLPSMQTADLNDLSSPQLLSLLSHHQLLLPLHQSILTDQAISGISLTPEETDQALQTFLTQNNITDPESQQTWCARNGIPPDQLPQIATRPLRLQKYKQQTWGNQIDSDFLRRKKDLDQISYHLLRTNNPETAQELYFRIKGGEASFSDLAAEYSQGPEAQTGGLIGPVPLSQPHASIADKLANAQPGQILPPLHIGEWYVLLQLETYSPAQLTPETRQQLLDDRFNAWLDEQTRQLNLLDLVTSQTADSSPDPSA